MKITTKTILACFILISTLNICLNKRGENGEESEAFAYNDGRKLTGLSFSMGSNGGYVVSPGAGYKAVETEKKLKARVPYSKGPKETVEEVPSNTEYYDGEMQLNAVKVNCHLYKNAQDCLHQAQCGWCHNKNTCVVGNSMGPMEDCPRANYQFNRSFPGYDNMVRINNHEMNGLTVRTFSHFKK